MDEPESIFSSERPEHQPLDPVERNARRDVEAFINSNSAKVFFSRQVEVIFEGKYFHWVTNRAIRDLEAARLVSSETRSLKTGGTIKLLWHKSFRYYRRAAAGLVSLVEEYADPNIGSALGLHGELMVLEGFAKCQFVTKGRNTNTFGGKTWMESNHDLDFIFERDGRPYGVEVKNMLGYMDQEEFRIKIKMCTSLGLAPVFVARMLPKSWIEELRQSGGFALILKWQLYPPAHKELAKRVHQQLSLPVDAPRALAEGTMARFLEWHLKSL